MQKIKTWRRFALATLALLFTAVLSFALVQIIPAAAEDTYDADGDNVFDDQVEYEIDDGASNGQQWLYTSDGKVNYTAKNAVGKDMPKSYEWDPNTYYSHINISNFTIPSVSKMTLTAKGNGTIKFEWKCISSTGNPGIVYFRIWKNDEDTNGTYIFDGYRDGGLVSTTYTQETISVVEGDKIYIECGNRNNHWLIHGLQKTTEEKAKFQQATGDNNVELSLNSEGTPHWTEKENSYTFSFDSGMTYPWEAAFPSIILYHFTSSAEQDCLSFSYSLQASIDDKEITPIYVYIDDIPQTFVMRISSDKEQFNKVDFVVPNEGEHILKISLEPLKDVKEHVDNFSFCVKAFETCAYSALQTREITFQYTDKLTVEGQEQPVKIAYENIDDSGADIDIKSNDKVAFPIGKKVKISISGLKKGGLKNSVIDPTQQVATTGEGYWRSNLDHFDEEILYYDKEGNLELQYTFYVIAQEDGFFFFNNGDTEDHRARWKFVAFDEVEDPTIGFDMVEYAPIPKITVTKQDNSGEEEVGEISEGQVIKFTFMQNNQALIYIQKFDGFTRDDIGIVVDDEDVSNMLQDGGGDNFYFPYQLKNRATISIFYRKTDESTIIYSDWSLSFSLKETLEGSIDESINHTAQETAGSVTIGNDNENEWEFDPAVSTMENRAFGLTVKTEEYRPGSGFYYGVNKVSNLSFTMTGAEEGSLSFQFRLEGYYMDAQLLGSAIRSGQLWWRSGTAFTVDDLNKVGVMNGDQWTETLDGATWIGRPATSKDGPMQFASGVIEVGDGWYQVNVPIQQGTALYLGFLVSGNDNTGLLEQNTCYAAIRDVRLITGSRNVKLKISSDANEGSSATATVGQTPYTASVDGQEMTVNAGALVQLSAQLAQDDKFYGWSVGGALVSTEQTASVYITDDGEIVAWIASKDYYTARADGAFYHTLKGAADGAKSGQTIYLLNKQTTATESFEIKKGVTLLLPFDETNRLTEMGAANTTAENKIAWLGTTYKTPYRSLTVQNGVTITVKGTIAVGGVTGIPGSTVYQGHTSGHYSEIILETGSKIDVQDGGVFDVYGRVWGGEGHYVDDMGTIDVAKGGKIYEPFLILDFAGGSNTLSLYSAGQTPFKRYAMINIECPMTINYGGALVGHASLYALNQYFSLDQTFVGDDSVLGKEGGLETFVMLSGENSKVTINYDASKALKSDHGGNVGNCTEGIGLIKMVFDGGAKFSYMCFSAMGITVPTNPVYFSIPYNYEVEMNGQGAQYETRTDFKIMPGAKVTLGEGATLTLNANTYVYDGLAQGALSGKSYPTAADLEAAGYSRSGNFIVNGTLIIGLKTRVEGFDIGSILGGGSSEFVPGQDPATFLGIIQTSGTTGRIEIPKDTVLRGTVVDGIAGNAHYFAYTTTARLYDKEHGGALVSLVPEDETKLSKAQTYTATSNTAFTLDTLKYTKTDGGAEDQTLTLNSDMVGSWMVDHEAHSFDWKSLSDEEKQLLEGAKYKDLHHQCTELGCADEEHKLLLSAEGFTLKDTYKGSAFTAEDLQKLFYKYYFGSEKVPAELAGCDFSASVSTGSEAIQNADDYENLTVTLTNGFFGDVNKTSETFTFTVEKFNLKDLDQAAIKESLSGLVYNGTAQTPELTLQADGLTGAVEHEALVWAGNVNAGENTASVTIKGSGTNFTGELTVNFSIEKATLTVEVVGKTKPYDGKAWEGVNKAVETTDFTVTDGTIYNSDDLGLKLTVENAGADVGSYTVKGEASNTNYTVTVTSGAYTITRAELTLTVTAGQKHIYGQSPTDLTFTITGFQGSDTENALKELFELRSEGHAQWADYQEDGYDITVSLKNGGTVTDGYEAKDDSALKNYKVKLVGAKYTVEKKDIEGATFTVTTAYTYDNTAKEPTMSEIEVAWTGYSESDHTGLGAQFAAFTVGSYLNNTDAGDATVVVTATGNFTGTKTVNFKIEKATVDSITVNGEYAYTGAVQSDAVKGNIVVKSGELILNTGDYTVTFDRNGEKDVKDAGAYTVTVTLTEACKNYQLGNVTTATFEVAKAEVTVKANDQTTPQNEQILKEFTYTVSGGTFFNDDEAEIKLHFQYTTEAVSDTVKDFDIIIDWQKGYTCDNYDVTFEKGTYHIIDAIFKNVTVTGDGQITYNGQSHTLTVEVNNEALAGKTTVTITKDGETFEGATNAGTYSIHVNIKATGYQTEYNADFTLTITPIKVTVTFDAKSSTYGDAVKTETELTYTMPEDVLPKDQDTFKAAIRPTTNAESKSAVSGKYKITAEKPELQNYDVTIVDGVYTITARPVEVTVNKQSVTYNQKQQSAQSRNGTDWSVTDLASGEEATVLNVKLEATGTDAKAYDITASWKNSNYAVTFKGAEGLTVEDNIVKEAFVIEAAALTEATVTGSYTYNGQTQTPTFTVKAGGLTVEEGGFELEFAADADRVSAGTVQVTVKAKSANYSGEVKTQFTIAAKKIEVTLKAQSFEYSGKVPTPDSKAYTVEEGGLCSRNGKEDDLGITITLVDGNKNVGSYSLEAEASNTDYEVTFDKTQKLNITKKHITVKADDLTSTYGDAIEELTYTAEGLVEGEDPETALHITLQPERTIKEAGTYTITGTGSATNYAFDGVEEGTYTVEKREVTVKINDQSALYDGTEPSVLQGQGEDAGWTIVSGDIIDSDNLHIVLTKTEGVDADKYAISGAFANDNYEVTFEGTMETAGTYTVTPRAVTVEIYNQSATYDFTLAGNNGYSFNGAAWTVEQESLAPGEEKTVLGVTLTKPAMSDAGIYAITGSAANTNYVVTFTGEYAGEDENAGKAGVYTVMKKDLSEEALFVLFVGKGGDEGEMDGDRTVRAKFSGDPLSLAGSATITEGDERRALEVTSDPATIEKIGDHTVTLTIVDKNYQGKTEFLVIVTDANGYTEKLLKTLDDLEKLVAELDIDRLTVDDYAKLVEIYNALAALSDEERETGAEKLAEYQAYVDAWDSLANIDDVVETAQAVANAPIETLFEAAAMLTALAGLAYIALKGGLL